MKYKVLVPFRDKESDTPYQQGDYIDSLSIKRYKVLSNQIKNAYNTKFIVIDAVDNSKKADLLEIAEAHNIKVSQDNTKAEILKALEG
ncbi:hypothetical protein [Staphylococcus equorum]|uniref:hypothetical protein n=1 Tax=Staphylococcus equorum TaxID=246432 RepID=UPI0025567ABF|nr:hypothetical protein [Staphylococcus equorum]MDK9857631.1 hypothetical protein [Staphylococcus equorum]MDK9874692.1 hypothetical protein [Staphylococcus equorum]